MKKIKMRCRRALALLLVFTMCMGTMAGTAFAAEDGTTDTAGTEAAGDTENDGGTTSGAESTPSSDTADTSNNDTTSGGTTSGTGSDKAEADGGSDGQSGTSGSESEAESTTTTTGPTTTTDASGAVTTTSGEKTEWKDENGDVVAKKETSESSTVKDDQLQSESKSEEYHQNPTDTMTEVKPAAPEGTEGSDPSVNQDVTEGDGTQGEAGIPEGPGHVEGGEDSGEPETKPEEPGDQVLDVDDWTVVDENGEPVPKEPLLDEEGNPVVDENGNPVFKDGVTVNMTPGGSDQKDIVANISKIVEEKIEEQLKDREGVEEYNEDGKTGYRYVDDEGEHIIIKVFDPTGQKLIGYETKLIVTTPGSVGPGGEVGAFDPNDPNAPPEWDQPNGAGTVTKIELPERPQIKTDEPDENGNLVTVEVKELYDVDSNGNFVLDALGQQVVVGYLTTTIVRDANGKQIEGYQKAEWGVRTTVVTNGDTTASTEDKLVVSTSSVSMVTRAITADGYVVDIDSAQKGFVEGSMSEVSNSSKDTINSIVPTVKEPSNGETDTKTDLYNRVDAEYAGYIVNTDDGTDLNIRTKPNETIVGSLKPGTKVYIFKTQELASGAVWGLISNDPQNERWIRLDGQTDISYKVTANTLNVRNNAGTSGTKVISTVSNGETYKILEFKQVGTTTWGKIQKGESIGWISLSYAQNATGPAASAEGQFVYLGDHGIESAIRINDKDNDGSQGDYQAHQFVIWDYEGKPHYVYCADLFTKPAENIQYGMTNIENATNYWANDPDLNQETAKKVQAIALNGYWGTSGQNRGSLGSVKQMMKAAIQAGKITTITEKEVDKYLTDGIALAATQAAIWSYGTARDGAQSSVNVNDPFGAYNLNGALYKGHADWYFDETDERVAKALFDYLRGLDGVEIPGITETNIKGSSITVKSLEKDAQGNPIVAETMDSDGNTAYKYKTDVSFVLDVKPSEVNGDLILTVFIEGEEPKKYRLAGDDSVTKYGVIKPDENDNYVIKDLVLADGQKITLNLSGVQDLGECAYLIRAQANGVTDTSLSQTFIGLEETKRNLNLSFDLTFNVGQPIVKVTESDSTTTEVISTVKRDWEKTSETKYTYKTPEDPKEPDTPDTPNTPNTPNTPSNPPTTRTRRDRSTPISDTPTPLAGIPDDPTPLAMLPEEQVPLAILDEDVPLASVPATGDISGLWYGLTLFAGLGLMGMGARNGKKRKDA